MAFQPIYASILEAHRQGKKQFALLIDPDKVKPGKLEKLLEMATHAGVDFFLVGGSLIVHDLLDYTLQAIKDHCTIPAVLFPGSSFQLNAKADGILFLSLLSGRNPELLIGQQVLAAPYLKNAQLEVLSTGYILIDGGVPTTVSYMSNTQPIPADKPEIAVCTAMAAEMLGFRIIYLDAGSGARTPVSESLIAGVRAAVEIPVIAGGGIRTPEQASAVLHAGADLVVVGNAIEKDPSLLSELVVAVHEVCARDLTGL